ncbi:MAG TPA: VanZ family protein [Candidatus Limnocylindrales bacterium]|nr:VanZ family protein [Candidatus Limnocylindrales bacterium]
MPDGLRELLSGYPGFFPGILATLVVAVAAAGRVARALGIKRALAAGLLLSVGIIVSATLFPDIFGLGRDGATPAAGWTCDTERFWPSLGELVELGESSANVALFVPLGIAIAFLPRIHLATALGAAIVSPFAIELVQLVAPSLHRACQTADVADNLTGLAIGLAAGAVWVAATRRRDGGSQER